jgi:undecaprenyl diphosphate synthase
MGNPWNSLRNLFLNRTSEKETIDKDFSTIRHVAIIMDGNGRWAKKRGLPRTAGHREGLQRVKEIAKAMSSLGISHLTLFAFSTENWRRPVIEVEFLMNLFKHALENEILELHQNNVRLRFIGFRQHLDASLLELMNRVEEMTAENDSLQLNLALNYGGRAEIVNACRQVVEQVQSGSLSIDEIDETVLSNYMLTNDIPDPDLLIRPSGELRLSNFLIWQSAYTEFYFTDVLWPDFRKDNLLNALNDYLRRDRRFGLVKGDRK